MQKGLHDRTKSCRPGQDGQQTPCAHRCPRLPSSGITLTGGNRNDVTQLVPLLEALPPVRGKHVRPRRRPDAVLADRGYVHDQYRRLLRLLGVKPLIAHRDTARGSGPGPQRRVAERVFACLYWFLRLRIRSAI
ncbi:hypothetical protein GCM10010372_78840 [Streptomyces tauricus]|nr:hypothetical protein GCM10010372_78840 [Streptomyces tauricus]